ncbi:T9SS type A sorting domain-containing protein [Bizionia arctica]|uniref:T9SS C-terminal target domain-containing protein n=1 Tax=Bizionia arctica TaxID=1495645 RepID=A0A917LLE7_9FLAO|nr:T9SS type A sorting domain-containing protein [Bizionia arctica]GGG39423.1 T9SS C-terminal target domain-containing protein [Bizionia arctica]
MKKHYLIIITIAIGLFTVNGFSQTNGMVLDNTSNIENLSIFPNPVSQDKVYITSNSNSPKIIEIYNVLGKNILTVTLTQNELNVSKLKAGVYILKITENGNSTTRKLVIR